MSRVLATPRIYKLKGAANNLVFKIQKLYKKFNWTIYLLYK